MPDPNLGWDMNQEFSSEPIKPATRSRAACPKCGSDGDYCHAFEGEPCGRTTPDRAADEDEWVYTVEKARVRDLPFYQDGFRDGWNAAMTQDHAAFKDILGGGK